MAETNEELKQVNVQMAADLAEKLDILVEESEIETDRSKFIRGLIRERWARRQQMVLPLEAAPAQKFRTRRATVAA